MMIIHRSSIHVIQIIIATLLLLFTARNGFSAAPDSEIGLTTEETVWLQSHQKLRVSYDPEFPPIEFLDEKGNHRGMASDYLVLIEQKLGVEFEIVTPDNWQHALEMMRKKSIDILTAVADTDQRREYMLFTPPYLKLPAVVITARTDIPDWSLDTLKQLKIAVVSDYAWDDWMTKSNPEIALIRVPDIETGLQTTAFGTADAMIGDIATTSHFIGKLGISNLRIARQVDQTLDLSMGIRIDQPLLRSIMGKALTAITEDEKSAINRGWINLEQPAWWEQRNVRIWITAITLSLITLITGIMLWNRSLSHRVEAKTRELEETQAHLLQAAKLESIGRLAAGVAHEVKNPLAIIQMGIDFVRPDFSKRPEEKQLIDDMQHAVDRANTIILGLLDFSRDQKLDIQKIDLNEVVGLSLSLVRYELEKNNVSITTKLKENSPPINADPNKLEQVLVNLFMNAMHAMEGGGELRIESSVSAINNSNDKSRFGKKHFRFGDNVVVLTIDDTGPGIDDEKLEKIFDPFYTTKPVGQGTGLGLSITRNIMDLHHAFIGFANRPEGGIRITLAFNANPGTMT